MSFMDVGGGGEVLLYSRECEEGNRTLSIHAWLVWDGRFKPCTLCPAFQEEVRVTVTPWY